MKYSFFEQIDLNSVVLNIEDCDFSPYCVDVDGLSYCKAGKNELVIHRYMIDAIIKDAIEQLEPRIRRRIAERTAEGLFGDKDNVSIQEICDIIRDEIKLVFGIENKYKIKEDQKGKDLLLRRAGES